MSGAPIWCVSIWGAPVPAARPRFDSVRRRTYTPSQYDRWKKAAARLCRNQWGAPEPVSVGVAVLVEVTLPRPKCKPAKGTLHRQYWHPTEDYPLPLRGDADNYAKAALDALVQGGVLKDDDLVVELSVTKCAGTRPGIDITLSLVEPEEADVSGVAAK